MKKLRSDLRDRHRWQKQYGINDGSRVFRISRSNFYPCRQHQGKVNPEWQKLKAVRVEHHKEARASAGSRTLV